MSLQGTIDTFEVPDILRLLASTKKTGQLSIAGNRGNGSVWVKGGDIVGSEASAAPWASSSAEVIFELLRYAEGDFVFHADDEVPEPANGKKAEKVDPVLNAASSMLKEWEEIEKVVPSLASPLRLSGKLPEPTVEINEASWRMIVGIGSGTTVGDLGNQLEQSEIVISRNVKQLIESKLVEIEHADPVLPSGTPLFRADATTPQVTYAPVEEAPMEVEAVEVPEAPAETVMYEAAEMPVEEPANGFMYADDAPSPFDYGASATATDEDIDLDDPVQVARAIENMDKEITQVVFMAARAESADEREAMLDDLRQRVGPLDFAVIQRFVYSLTA
jgi:hypothetical protein